MLTKHPKAARRTLAFAAAAAVTALGVPAAAQSAAAAEGEVSTAGIRASVTVAKMLRHQRALQTIADTHGGGNRLAGTIGYDKSGEYVEAQLRSWGYQPVRHNFRFTLVAERTPSVLTQVAPTPTSYVNGVEFAIMSYSGSGDVTAAVQAVDLVVPMPADAPASTSTSGCEAADFAGFVPGNIALMQRGLCTFGEKADNAKAAGATGVIVMNEGQEALGRAGLLNGTLGEPPRTIPAVGISYALGVDLANGVTSGTTGTTMRLRTDTIAEDRDTFNILAETPGGDPNSVMVVGAHLDSVARGPGINDNGSGSAGVLEIARAMAEDPEHADPATGIRNKIRFAWWGAEEHGLIGSTRYVNSLSAAELAKIKLNLNFDMIASPNYGRFVYDGDNSRFGVGAGSAAGPQGSGEIERIFHDYFGSVSLASEETPFSGRSDYGPFIAKGIPAGGLFTGAEGVKTAEQVAKFGGTAGVAYDRCYHLGCDTLANLNLAGFEEMADAAAHTALRLAYRDLTARPLVNPSGPVGPAGGTGTGSGGGLHEDHDHDPVTS